MALDGGLIAGYLAAAARGAGGTSADRRVNSLLERLSARVTQGIGRGPLDRLGQNPHDEATLQEVGLTIDGAIARDRRFARDVTAIVAELDKRGGQQLIDQAYSQPNPSAFGHSTVAGRGSGVHPMLWFHPATAPLWAKVFVVLGGVVIVTAFVIFGYTFATDMPELGDPDSFEIPLGFPLAFGTFFFGVVLMGIGSLGAALSKRR